MKAMTIAATMVARRRGRAVRVHLLAASLAASVWPGATAQAATEVARREGDAFDAGTSYGAASDAGATDAVPDQPSSKVGATDASPSSSSSSGERPGRAHGLTPPRLIFLPQVTCAEGNTLAAGETVALRVTVDPRGGVTGAEITSAVEERIAVAAREAALDARFEPATRDGVSVSARVGIRVGCRVPVSSSPPTPLAPGNPAPVRTPANPAPAPVVEVVARGAREVETLRRSARAVTVVETREAKRSSSDLGEVMARSEGVTVQRAGALGSRSRFSLNGLTNDQIRFYLDGVPLDLAGFPLGLANVPVNLIDRIEVYRGVVPIRFGGDALGGAVNLVTNAEVEGTRGALSYQTGSFGTHRITGVGHHRFDGSHFVARAHLFHDQATNDYLVDVRVPDAQGREQDVRVRRFHDGYRGTGAGFEAGWVKAPWAEQLLLRLFVNDTAKELQHNPTMTVPYGDATSASTTAGATLRFRRAFGPALVSDIFGGYSYARARFLDVGSCVYSWFGTCARAQAEPGETGPNPRDTLLGTHAAYLRAHLIWHLSKRHGFEIALAPSAVSQSGDERRQRDPAAPDPLQAPRRLLSAVVGLEHHLHLAADRLENIAFTKAYLQDARMDESSTSGASGTRERQTLQGGAGDSLRLRLASWLDVKGSYEYATRLPRADETFGDGALVESNPRLEPEVSHNANVGLMASHASTLGRWSFRVNGFWRALDRLIVLTGAALYFRYDNAGRARAIGAEAAGNWTSPNGVYAVEASVTHQDLRATDGTFKGDRVPNRPFLYGSGSLRARLDHIADPRDSLSFFVNSRYVHDFFLTWESLGAAADKATVGSQLTHGAGLTYALPGTPTSLAFTLEMLNVTNARVTDFYGVQRPGRAVFFKVVAEH